jgi:galactokinase
MHTNMAAGSHAPTLFEDMPYVVRAPGRVNLIGEHTDYNGGLVLPAAIDSAIWVAARPSAERSTTIHALNLPDVRVVHLDPPFTRRGDWSDYVVGVMWALVDAGVSVAPATLAIFGELPIGAGLSSSAALELGVAVALLEVSGASVGDLMRLAEICRRAENDFVGARVGVMDHIAVALGRRDHCLLVDCDTLAVEPIPIPPDLALVVCNTMISHAHASGGYNERRAECDQALDRLRPVLPALRFLTEVMPADLDRYRERLPDVLVRRVRHVITENARVTRAAAALRSGDVVTLGECMAASHRSLRDDFEVSTPELDLMVSIASRQPGVHGSRMTGGGFGGSTVNVVDTGKAPRLVEVIKREYSKETGVMPDVLVCRASDGVAVVP